MIIDRYSRNIMSPCNRCKNMESFTEHSCKHYHGKDKIPQKIFSGEIEKCRYFDEEEKWKQNTTGH